MLKRNRPYCRYVMHTTFGDSGKENGHDMSFSQAGFSVHAWPATRHALKERATSYLRLHSLADCRPKDKGASRNWPLT